MNIDINWRSPPDSTKFLDLNVGQPFAITFGVDRVPEVYLKVHDAGAFRVGDSGDIMAIEPSQAVHKLGLKVLVWLDLS